MELVSDGIAEVLPEGIRTEAGRVVELDVLIYATGYAAGDPAYPFEVMGLEMNHCRPIGEDESEPIMG